jgi:hypothetical protein
MFRAASDAEVVTVETATVLVRRFMILPFAILLLAGQWDKLSHRIGCRELSGQNRFQSSDDIQKIAAAGILP